MNTSHGVLSRIKNSKSYINSSAYIHGSRAYQYVAPRVAPKAKAFIEGAAEVASPVANAANCFYAYPEIPLIFAVAYAAEPFSFGISRYLPLGACCASAVVREVVQERASIKNIRMLGDSIDNGFKRGEANWMLGLVVLGVAAMTVGCVDHPTTAADAPIPDNPAMCAVHGPDDTAILSFGPQHSIDSDGRDHYVLPVPAGISSPEIQDGVSGDIYVTKAYMPYHAVKGTAVCPIENGSVCLPCRPIQESDVAYLNDLKANPAAAQAALVANAGDSHAIQSVVNNVNAEASYTNSAPPGYDDEDDLRVSLFHYESFIYRFLHPATPSVG